MKKNFLGIVAVCTMLLATSCTGLNQIGSQNDSNILGQVLGSGAAGGALSNIIEGVFTQSDINVSDMAGEWTSTGSAVNFHSENFLAKAGGLAAAGAIENKLDPYYNQYGLIGAVFNIQSNGNFTLTAKGMTLNGTITKQSDGNFTFNFSALGLFNIGKLTAYVTKSGNTMNIMFDASKLKDILGVVAGFSGSTLANTATSLLNNYDGMMVGFKLNRTGNAANTNNNSNGSFLDSLLGL